MSKDLTETVVNLARGKTFECLGDTYKVTGELDGQLLMMRLTSDETEVYELDAELFFLELIDGHIRPCDTRQR